MKQDNVIVRQEMNDDELTIDLGELFMVLWSKIHIILLSTILLALVAFVGTKIFITPQYTSETKMYVLSKQDASAGVTYNDLITGTQLTKDYMELVKSRPVLEQAIAVLNLDMSADELSNMVSVENQTDTRIISIQVTSPKPKQAKEIADAIREAVGAQITKITDADAVNTVEEGSLPTSPSSPNVAKNMAMGGILGFILAVGILTLIYILDDTIKTPDDVEKYLGLNVLTSIPIQEGTRKPKKAKQKKMRK